MGIGGLVSPEPHLLISVGVAPVGSFFIVCWMFFWGASALADGLCVVTVRCSCEYLAELAAFVETNETDPISYEVYFGDEGRVMTVLQVHPDSASMERHMELAGPVFAKFADLVVLRTIDIYGSPSEKVVEQLRRRGLVVFVSEHFDGVPWLERVYVCGSLWDAYEMGGTADVHCYTPAEFERKRESLRVVREAAEHAEEDRARRSATESRNEADALVYQGERLLKDLDDKLSDEEKAEVNARIEAVREALKGEDAGAVDSTKGQLAEVLQRIGTKAYEATGAPGDGNGTDGAVPGVTEM